MAKLPELHVENVLTPYTGSRGYHVTDLMNVCDALEAADYPKSGIVTGDLYDAIRLHSATEATKRRHFSARGRFLFGVTLGNNLQASASEEIDGLLFAHEQRIRLADAGPRVVQLASWIKTEKLRRYSTEEVRTIHEQFADKVLAEPNARGYAGGLVPVSSFTTVEHHLLGVAAEPILFSYGERRDTRKIQAQGFDPDLTQTLVQAVDAWYTPHHTPPASH